MKIDCQQCNTSFEISRVAIEYYCPWCGETLKPFKDGVEFDRQVKEGLDFLDKYKEKMKLSISTKIISFLRKNGFWMASSWIENNQELYNIYLKYGMKNV